jgi:hypothetical protein
MHARRHLAAVVFLAMAAFVMLIVLTIRPVGAAFTGSTSNSGNSFASATDFETGSLLTWGSTNRAQTVPARVDSSSGWTASALGSVNDCEIRSPGTPTVSASLALCAPAAPCSAGVATAAARSATAPPRLG